MKAKSVDAVLTLVGKRRLDSSGAVVGAACMDPQNAYGAVPLLLKEYINNGSEKAWAEICQRVDNVYVAVSRAMEVLDSETSFSAEVLERLKTGQKLLFKPNMVMLPLIDFQSHGPALIGNATPWEFVAALMRWFHDRLDISYHQMAMGEAGTTTSRLAAMASRTEECEVVTTQAIMEGKFGNNYGGWGFYFVRKYLADCHNSAHTDNPMNGYQESIAGVCLPPGKANDKLLVYDLNKIANDISNGREVPVADGIIFQTITLHKAIVGGDPNDVRDRSDWPGCILINVSKLKIHQRTLFTAALKNLGIGLYPMEANESREPGKIQWKYAIPNLEIPAVKMRIPHNRWTVETDPESGAPLRDKDGNYQWQRTGGLDAAMADVIQAVIGQGIKMVHVVDAIEAVNTNHIGPRCELVPEGFVFASIDPVALDTCCSRYLFSMVPIAEVETVRRQYNLASDVIQKVPMPEMTGDNINTGEGYDSAYSRYSALQHCAGRGLGQPEFCVAGDDLWRGGSLASLRQRLGRVSDGVFSELLTTTLYHTPNKPLWDLQATSLAYLELNDRLTGSDFKQRVMKAFDENGDGIIDYMEMGRGYAPVLGSYGIGLMLQNMDPLPAINFRFLLAITPVKRLKTEWNPDGHNFGEETMLAQAIARALAMSKAAREMPDPFFPGRVWGKGKWPSFQYAIHREISALIYGQAFPERFDLTTSPYGCAFHYADVKWNGAIYCNRQAIAQNEDIIGNYHRAVASGAPLLPFIFYVPHGLGSIGDGHIPNVAETDDPNLVFTASLNGTEVWRDLRLSSFNLR